MSIDLTQLLRFEVEREPDAGELINLVVNPSGALGAWGWETPVAGSNLRGGVSRLTYRSPGGVPSFFYTEPVAVTPGTYVTSRWIADAVTGLYKVQIEWLDGDKAPTTATAATSNFSSSASPRVYGSFAVPSGIAYCRLRFDHLAAGGGNPTAGAIMQIHEVALTAAATSSVLGYTRTNLLFNPSAESNASYWIAEDCTVQRSADQAQVGTHSFKVTKTGGAGKAVAISTTGDVKGGRDYAFQFRAKPGTKARTARVSARWFTGSGKEITTVAVKAASETPGAWSGVIGGVVTAPTNADILQMRVAFLGCANGEVHYFDAAMAERSKTVGSYFDGATADSGGVIHDWTGATGGSPSIEMGASGDVGTIVPVPYQNILGPTAQITVDREDLNVGSLTAKIFDAVLDPTQSDLIKPGKRARLVTVDGDVVFAGKVLTGNVTYHLLELDEQNRAEVTLTVVDPITALAAAKRRDGVATIAELPYVLEGAGVPWSCNGNGNQVPTATVVAYNDNASALDQVAVTRDTVLGYAWVDRNGVLQAWDRDELDATVAATLDEATYNANIDISYDLDRIINTVSVNVLRVIATTGASEEVAFGPYRDDASVRQYGEHAATYTVQGIDVTDTAGIADYAQAILDTNATPALKVNSLTLPIQTAGELPLALLDLYDLVAVQNDRAGIDENVRLTTIQHNITPGKWLVTVGFSGDGVAAPSSAVPAPPPSVGAVVAEVKDDLDARLAELDTDLAELNDVTLPALNADLTELNTVTLPGLVSDLATANSDLATNAAAIAGLGGLFPITSTSISDNAVTTAKMTANSINGDRIAANTLNASKIVAGSITTDRMTANSISGDRITAGTLSASKIVANSIGASQIAANSIGAGQITANSIGAGQLTATAIDAKTITGVTINGASLIGSLIVKDSGGTVRGAVYASGTDMYVTAATDDLHLASPSTISLGSPSIDLAATVVSANGELHGDSVFVDSAPTTGSAANVFIGTLGQLNKSTSSRRYKYDIDDAELDAAGFLDLRPTTHRRYDDLDYDEAAPEAARLYLSLIAEEVADAGFGWCVVLDEQGRPDAIDWQAFALYTFAALKDTKQSHAEQLANLTARIEQLEA